MHSGAVAGAAPIGEAGEEGAAELDELEYEQDDPQNSVHLWCRCRCRRRCRSRCKCRCRSRCRTCVTLVCQKVK